MPKRKSNYDCPNAERVDALQTVYEGSFYDKSTYSPASIRWLERTNKALWKQLHHALCGHCGERWISGAPVDSYDPGTRTVFQCHSIQWYGCVRCFPNDRHDIVNNGKTRGVL